MDHEECQTKIFDAIGDMKTSIGEMKTVIGEVKEQVTGIDLAVCGDSDRGVDGVKQKLEKHNKQLEGLEKFKIRAIIWIVASAAAAGGGFNAVAKYFL